MPKRHKIKGPQPPATVVARPASSVNLPHLKQIQGPTRKPKGWVRLEPGALAPWLAKGGEPGAPELSPEILRKWTKSSRLIK